MTRVTIRNAAFILFSYLVLMNIMKVDFSDIWCSNKTTLSATLTAHAFVMHLVRRASIYTRVWFVVQ